MSETPAEEGPEPVEERLGGSPGAPASPEVLAEIQARMRRLK